MGAEDMSSPSSQTPRGITLTHSLSLNEEPCRLARMERPADWWESEEYPSPPTPKKHHHHQHLTSSLVQGRSTLLREHSWQNSLNFLLTHMFIISSRCTTTPALAPSTHRQHP